MSVRVEHGDCIEVMRQLAADGVRVDAIVCDPPYGISFMGKDWDSPGGLGNFPMRRSHETNMVNTGVTRQGGRQRSGVDFAKRQLRDAQAFGRWCEEWALAAFDLLPPGGHLAAFGGTRMYHRLASGIEDAGFEVRDQIAWAFGSGFPKSRNIGREVAAAEGWGTALKPAWEPICLARKPLIGTVASNFVKHGTGAINVDGCRVFGDETPAAREGEPSQESRYTDQGSTNFAAAPGRRYTVKRLKPGATLDKTGGNWRPDEGPLYEGELKPGRWPANLCHDGSDEVMEAFAAFGERTSGSFDGNRQSGKLGGVYGDFEGAKGERAYDGNSGTAARFFFSAKADADDRCDSKHPTVKPVALMRWLARLVTPPGGTVLDPFAGSGTTGVACLREGFNAILIEREDQYVKDIRHRLDKLSGLDSPLFARAAV